jgi:hypothetical protein
MKDHIFISDLDGTLLRRDARLSPRGRDLLAHSLDAGIAFTVASARSVASIATILNGLRLPLPVIEFNGAFIRDLETGRHPRNRAGIARVPGFFYRSSSREAALQAGFSPLRIFRAFYPILLALGRRRGRRTV